MAWTDERVEQLKDMWNEGMSASQIAKALGGVTRNAVIGKVHRLGLSNRGASGGAAQPGSDEAPVTERPRAEEKEAGPAEPAAEPAPETKAADAAAPAAPAPRQPPAIRDASEPRAPGQPTPEEEEARRTLAEIEKMARRLSLLELTERTCKWPIGDPTEESFHFCGLQAIPGKPYCEHHVTIAFQPMSNRRDRRPGR